MKKMKKFLSLLLCLVMCGSIGITAVGCDEDEGDGTQTEQPDGGNEDGGNEDGGNENEGGENTGDEIENVTVKDPTWVTEFETNSGEKENKETEFFVKDKSYKVGDDNPFVFKPAVTYTTADLEDVAEPADASFAYTLEEKAENGDWTAADGALLLDGEGFDAKKCTFDFATAAIGKTLRLTVTPVVSGVENAGSASFTFEVVDGYNAYNDYDLAYISNYAEVNNVTSIGTGDNTEDNHFAWKAFREAKGLTLNPNDVKGIILHKNIQLTKDSFPDIFFYSQEEVDGLPNAKWLVGSLKDQVASGLYYRDILNNDSFSIYGNYYNLDVSKMPYTYKGAADSNYSQMAAQFDEKGNITSSDMISHASLMRIHANEGDGIDKNKTKALVTDISLIGNSPKTEDKKVQGGLIFVKTQKTDCTIDNVISHSYFITAMGQTIHSKATFKNFKCFDSFNAPIYNWGCEDMSLDNCLIRNCGGPAIIADSYMSGSTPVSPRIVATNCTFDYQLTGDENWFVMANATPIIGQVKEIGKIYDSLNTKVDLFNQYGYAVNKRSFMKVDEKDSSITWMKPVVIVKDDGASVLNKGAYNPYISINGSVMDFGTGATAYGETVTDPVHSTTLAGTLTQAAVGGGAPVLETTAGGLAYYNGTDLTHPKQNANDPTSPISEAANMLKGDYMNLYYYTGTGGASFGLLGVMFELYDL